MSKKNKIAKIIFCPSNSAETVCFGLILKNDLEICLGILKAHKNIGVLSELDSQEFMNFIDKYVKQFRQNGNILPNHDVSVASGLIKITPFEISENVTTPIKKATEECLGAIPEIIDHCGLDDLLITKTRLNRNSINDNGLLELSCGYCHKNILMSPFDFVDGVECDKCGNVLKQPRSSSHIGSYISSFRKEQRIPKPEFDGDDFEYKQKHSGV